MVEAASLLANLRGADLAWEPFPHVVVRECLDPALCDALIAEYPSMGRVSGRARWSSNERFSYSAREGVADPELSPLWREMLRVHTSQAFLDQVLSLLGPAIRARYPEFEERFGALSTLRAGVRGVDGFDAADVALDAQICINTPVTGRASSVRRGHVDRFDKLFAGLFYLRHPEDDSRGGDLEIYRFRPGGDRRFNDKYIDDRWIEPVKTVAYERNALVLLLNGHDALHGVTPRLPTRHPRWFLNLLGEVRGPLFDLDDRQMPLAQLRRTARLAGDWLYRATSPRPQEAPGARE